MSKKKSLVGWTHKKWLEDFLGGHKFIQIEFPDIYTRTKDVGDWCPDEFLAAKKVKVTIEEAGR